MENVNNDEKIYGIKNINGVNQYAEIVNSYPEYFCYNGVSKQYIENSDVLEDTFDLSKIYSTDCESGEHWVISDDITG